MKADFWNNFDPYTYIQNNYITIHEEDKDIIQRLLKFYASIGKFDKALEIGTGPNLYPIMLLFPYAKKIDCIEYSLKNIQYLRKQIRKPDLNWNIFWEFIKKGNQDYRGDLLQNLEKKCTIKKGDIYMLPADTYYLASMFFCAESITDNLEQFTSACSSFIRTVKKKGYLVAAFMENSKGYDINGISFPAYPVDIPLLRKIFTPHTDNLVLEHISIANNPLRPGYSGMVLLTSQRK